MLRNQVVAPLFFLVLLLSFRAGITHHSFTFCHSPQATCALALCCEPVATTISLCGSGAESHSARLRAAGGATATVDGGDPTAPATADVAAADQTASRCTSNRWDREAVIATAVEHERL